MERNIRLGMVIFIVCMMGYIQTALSQSIYKIRDSKNSSMKLSGTSTLHDWTMNARTAAGEAQFGFNSEKIHKLISLKALTFSLVVLDLKSGKRKLDKNAYKALKTDNHKFISYKLISATVLPENENKYLIRTSGNLTVAGVTKEIMMDVYCAVNKDESITCSGSDKLRMTDYLVIPPTFMLGTMKTGDDITLDFTMVYKK